MQKHPMTPKGHAALRKRLKQIKEVDRPANIQAIEEARAHGDLSENAEYHAAKERQSFLAGERAMIETRLALAEVIDPTSLSGERVMFGAHVSLYDLDKDVDTTYQIVGEDEADIKQNKISYKSPFARALIGKEIGEEVAIRVPAGVRNVEISDVVFK